VQKNNKQFKPKEEENSRDTIAHFSRKTNISAAAFYLCVSFFDSPEMGN
jgi:hypothetical protein